MPRLKSRRCCGGGYWERNHDTLSEEQRREGAGSETERAQKRRLSFCNGTLWRVAYHTLHSPGAPWQQGERKGLREAEVQGLHLFQHHFNYFGRRRLVKQMHSGTQATTGRNPPPPKRQWRLRFLPFPFKTFLPSLVFVKLMQQLGSTEGVYRSTLITRQMWEKERRRVGRGGEAGGKNKSTRKTNEKGRWSKVNTDRDRQCGRYEPFEGGGW